jgi:hypothetical protein
MLKIIKFPVLFLTLSLFVFLPKISFAWEDQHGRDNGRSHHEHGYRLHANPDLTLVTGMDTIDRRVLIASGPDQTPEVIYQSVPEDVATVPAQFINSDTESVFIVNVPNNAGGYTPIRIEKWGNGYLGPQGELYYPFPQVSQLKTIYGL